jgi:hypothetical protein
MQPSTLDSVVSAKSAVFLHGDTVIIERRREGEPRRRVTYLVLADTVYVLKDGTRTAASPFLANVIRESTAQNRAFIARQRRFR